MRDKLLIFGIGKQNDKTVKMTKHRIGKNPPSSQQACPTISKIIPYPITPSQGS